MNWITTEEFISMLKHFYDHKIEVSLYLDHRIGSTHWWTFNRRERRFYRDNDSDCTGFSEAEMLRFYADRRWRPLSFLHLNHKSQELASRLVEELIMANRLEEIIILNDITFVRECNHCHQLMNEGWIVNDIETYCSDRCLQQAYTKVDMDLIKSQAEDEDAVAYWSSFE